MELIVSQVIKRSQWLGISWRVAQDDAGAGVCASEIPALCRAHHQARGRIKQPHRADCDCSLFDCGGLVEISHEVYQEEHCLGEGRTVPSKEAEWHAEDPVSVAACRTASAPVPRTRTSLTRSTSTTSVPRSSRASRATVGLVDGARVPLTSPFCSSPEYVLEDVLRNTMPNVLQPYEALAVNDSDKIVTPSEELLAALDKSQPLTFKVGMDIMPKVDFKRDYKGLEVSVTAAGNEDTARKTVERVIRSFRKSKGSLRVKAEGGATAEDVVIVSFDAFQKDTKVRASFCASLAAPRGFGNRSGNSACLQEAIGGFTTRNSRVELDDKDALVPGLVEGLMGIKAGHLAAPGSDRQRPQTFSPPHARRPASLGRFWSLSLRITAPSTCATSRPTLRSSARRC